MRHIVSDIPGLTSVCLRRIFDIPVAPPVSTQMTGLVIAVFPLLLSRHPKTAIPSRQISSVADTSSPHLA